MTVLRFLVAMFAQRKPYERGQFSGWRVLENRRDIERQGYASAMSEPPPSDNGSLMDGRSANGRFTAGHRFSRGKQPGERARATVMAAIAQQRRDRGHTQDRRSGQGGRSAIFSPSRRSRRSAWATGKLRSNHCR
jgi:hypothetical protein